MSLFSRKKPEYKPDYEKQAEEFQSKFALAVYKKLRLYANNSIDIDFQAFINSCTEIQLQSLIVIADNNYKTLAVCLHNTEQYTVDRLLNNLQIRQAYLVAHHFIECDVPKKYEIDEAKEYVMKYIRSQIERGGSYE